MNLQVNFKHIIERAGGLPVNIIVMAVTVASASPELLQCASVEALYG